MTKGNNSSRSANNSINTTMVNNSPLQHKYCHCIYDQRHNLQPIGSVLHRRRLTTLLLMLRFNSSANHGCPVMSFFSLKGTCTIIILLLLQHQIPQPLLLPTSTNTNRKNTTTSTIKTPTLLLNARITTTHC